MLSEYFQWLWDQFVVNCCYGMPHGLWVGLYIPWWTAEYRKACCWIYQLLWYTITIVLFKRLLLTIFRSKLLLLPFLLPLLLPLLLLLLLVLLLPFHAAPNSFDSRVSRFMNLLFKDQQSQPLWVLIYLPGHMVKQLSMLCWMLIWPVFFYRNRFDYFCTIL